MKVRLTQLDGKLPNLALMKLAHWHQAQGDQVVLAKTPSPSLFEPRDYNLVYGSAIFKWSLPLVTGASVSPRGAAAFSEPEFTEAEAEAMLPLPGFGELDRE